MTAPGEGRPRTRRRARGLTLAVLALTVLALALLVATEPRGVARAASTAGQGKELAPGRAEEITLDLARRSYAEFHVDVPAESVLLRWRIVSRRVELDLRARRGAPVDGDDPSGDDGRLRTEGGQAEFVYDRVSPTPVAPGRFFARVEWPFEDRPRTVGERLDTVTFTIVAEVTPTRVDGALPLPATVRGHLDASCGSFRAYTLDLPEGARALRLDVSDADLDLDLFARPGGPILALDEHVRFAQHSSGRETLLLQGTDEAPLAAGRWYVEVVDAFGMARGGEFTLRVRADATPPPELLAIPPLAPAHGDGPLARALAAVVELSLDDSAGSGTLLTRDGWILTNAHVVEDMGGATARDVVVALTLDPRAPATELFRGDVRHVDATLDLALVKITRGFYGQPLAPDLALPCLEVAWDPLPHVGDTLFLVGYPTTGGQGSRVTISATRGIVAGYDRASFGAVLKTDAEITSGNSGGAALDERGRLVGVPTSTVENGSGQIGYVHPIAALPPTWRDEVFGPPSSPR